MVPPSYMQSVVDIMQCTTAYIFLSARSKVSKVALLKIRLFLDVRPCQWVSVSRCLEGTDLCLQRLMKMSRNTDPVTWYHISADLDNHFDTCLLNFLSLVLMFIFNQHQEYNSETAYKFKMRKPAGTSCKLRHFQYKAHTNRSSAYLVHYTLFELFRNMLLYWLPPHMYMWE